VLATIGQAFVTAGQRAELEEEEEYYDEEELDAEYAQYAQEHGGMSEQEYHDLYVRTDVQGGLRGSGPGGLAMLLSVLQSESGEPDSRVPYLQGGNSQDPYYASVPNASPYSQPGDDYEMAAVGCACMACLPQGAWS
jgi:hypothetical protein